MSFFMVLNLAKNLLKKGKTKRSLVCTVLLLNWIKKLLLIFFYIYEFAAIFVPCLALLLSQSRYQEFFNHFLCLCGVLGTN